VAASARITVSGTPTSVLNDPTGAEEAYRLILPEIVFVMRGIEHLVAYGKRIFGSRAGLPAHERAPCEPVTAFGLACAARYASRLGPFGSGTGLATEVAAPRRVGQTSPTC